jgi:colicin import membrane protein
MSATKHNSSGVGGSPYQVPPEPNRWPSIGLAVGVHALLLAFLAVGINWQNNQPVAVEAEVWDMKVQSAAPPAPTPPPQAEPEPEPEPEPETPPPAPRVVEPPKVEQPAPPKQPDIALEREKKRKQELKRQQQLEEERAERERELAQQKREQEKKDKALAEKKAREDAEKKELAKKELARKEEADKKKKAEKEKAEQLAKEKAAQEKAAQEKADKLAKAKAEKAENAKLAKLRDEEMKRMMAGAGNPGSTGTAEKSTAPRRDNGYIAAITAAVKSKAHYGGSQDEPGNPTATFRVEQLPTGDILSIKMTKSSGVPAFDEAVKRAIDAASPLPKKKDGTVERSLEINFHMKDMQ